MEYENNLVPAKNLGQGHFENGNPVFSITSVCDIVADPKNFIRKKELFGQYVYENEITLLGGSANTGKSLLGMDIAIACASGQHYWTDKFTCSPKGKVLLIDTELTDAQFTRRYPTLNEMPNLYRARLWNACTMEMISTLDAIERVLQANDAPSLIVLDNLTTLVSLTSARDVQLFLQQLKRIKDNYQCTMVIISHLNKLNSHRPIELDDFRGSKMLINMADQVLALCNTKEGNDTKYLKILKSRNARIPETVSVLHITDAPYLHFEYDDEELEVDLLPRPGKRGPSGSINQAQAERIVTMKEKGVTIRGIAEALGISKKCGWSLR